MAGFVGERDGQGVGVGLHGGDVEDAIVVEVGDYGVGEHIIAAVDGEVDRLGVAKGAGGGVGPWSHCECHGETGGGGVRGGGVKGSGELVASGRKDVAQD